MGTHLTKRTPKAIIAISIPLLVGVLLPLLPTRNVSAQGDNFSWKNHTTIQYSGGDLGNGTLGGSGNSLAGIVTYQNKCQLNLTLNLKSDNSAVSLATGVDSVGPAGSGGLPSCDVKNQDNSSRFPGVVASYQNKLLSIQGTRPAQDNNTPETSAQKALDITLHTYSAQNPPANITFTIKKSGSTVVTETASKTTYDAGNIVYIAYTSVDPGTYQICFSALIQQCQTFTKVKYQPLNLSYGSTADDQKINVALTVNPIVNGTDTVTAGPFTITSTDDKGNTTTIQTESRDITGNGAGGVYTTEFDESFDNVKPGNYTVCLQGTTVCQNVVKKDGAAAKVTLTADGADTVAASPSGADEGDASTGCSFSINPLTWIACPVVGILEEAVRGIDNFITSALTINADSVFDTSGGYYKAWSSFRILATAVIIIAGIVMVASQALGFEFLDAYTIRKVLPRLLIAIIGISLSWPLMKFVVVFFNTLGYDIRNLIYSPFGNLHVGALNAGTLLTLNVGIVGTLFVMGIGATLSLLLTAALAILVGFLIIIVRDMAIIVLIIVAPIALACYILPNTQKVWKLWSDNFLGLMMMFPIISAFIAVGKVFSAVSLNPQGSDSAAWGSGTVMQIVGFLAYFIPYFLLPIAFRLATGVIGSIAGFVNDRNRGVFDRLKKGRQERMADRMGRARNNNLWDNNSKVGHWANKAAGWVTDPLDNAAYAGRNKIPGLRRRGLRIASSIEHARTEQSGKLFEELNKMGYNDRAYRALSGAHEGLEGETQDRLRAAELYGKAPRSIKELQQVADILSQSSAAGEKLGATAIEGSIGRLTTLYQDPEMGKADLAAAGIMGLSAHGFADGEDLATVGNNLQGDKRQSAAFAQSVISQAQLLGSRSRPDVKPGYGVVYRGGEFTSGTKEGGERARSVIKSLSSHDLAGAKGGAFDTLEPTIREMLDRNHPDYNPAEAAAVQDQLFSWAGPYSQASVDVKAKAIKFIQERSQADTVFGDAWRKYQRQEDPSVRRGDGRPGQGEDGAPGAQGSSGPTG